MTPRWREKDSNPRSPRRGQHFFETSPEAEEVRFATDSLLERAGFEPSVPRQKARSRCWHPDDHRRNAPPKVRFATDSPLEGDGFELSVPG